MFSGILECERELLQDAHIERRKADEGPVGYGVCFCACAGTCVWLACVYLSQRLEQ